MAEETPIQSQPAPQPTLEAVAAPAQAPVAAAEPAQPAEPPVGDDEMSDEELEELRANEVAYSWEASEYVHHHKGMGWYVGLIVLMVVLIGLAVLLKLWLTIGAFLAMGVAIVVFARKPPRTLMYELSQQGIRVDGKDFPYSTFRSFGVLTEPEWHTIDLEPAQRFSTRLAILFDDEDFDIIVGHLELHLPRTDHEPDVIERLTRLARF